MGGHRPEEVGTLKACVNSDHIEDDKWGAAGWCGLACLLPCDLQKN